MMTIEMTKVKKRVDGAAVGGKAHYLASKNGDLFQVSAAHERWDGTVPSAEKMHLIVDVTARSLRTPRD